jgi:hypothetical protein
MLAQGFLPVMLNLPDQIPKEILKCLRNYLVILILSRLFKDISLCLVKEAPLYNLYLKGGISHTQRVLIETIKEIKKHIPNMSGLKELLETFLLL